MPNLSYLHIPDSPHPSRPQGFANREDLLVRLTTNLIDVGNLVSSGRATGQLASLVVHGYKGVGKSSLIVESLRALRGELDFGLGFRSDVSEEMFPPAQQRERWIILYLRGKSSRDIKDATTNAQATLQASLASLFSSDQMVPELNRLPLPELSLLGKLFKNVEHATREKLKTAIQAAVTALQQAREMQGGVRGIKRGIQVQRASKSEAAAGFNESFSVGVGGNRIGATVSGGIDDRYLNNADMEVTEEVRQELNFDMFVDALNPFFTTCAELRIPTFLVLDDADELVTFADSHSRRAEFLRIILGTVGRLACTGLVLGLRNEYLQEDIFRNFTPYPVQPMTPKSALQALEAWMDLQSPPSTREQREVWLNVASTLLAGHSPEDPGVVPWSFFSVLRSLDRNRDLSGRSPRALVEMSIKNVYSASIVRLLLRLSERMPSEDRSACLAAEALDPEPYALKMTERRDLDQVGLLRAAYPGNPDDPRIVLDPIVAWLAVAPR